MTDGKIKAVIKQIFALDNLEDLDRITAICQSLDGDGYRALKHRLREMLADTNRAIATIEETQKALAWWNAHVGHHLPIKSDK
jgi:hypothetical protein